MPLLFNYQTEKLIKAEPDTIKVPSNQSTAGTITLAISGVQPEEEFQIGSHSTGVLPEPTALLGWDDPYGPSWKTVTYNTGDEGLWLYFAFDNELIDQVTITITNANSSQQSYYPTKHLCSSESDHPRFEFEFKKTSNDKTIGSMFVRIDHGETSFVLKVPGLSNSARPATATCTLTSTEPDAPPIPKVMPPGDPVSVLQPNHLERDIPTYPITATMTSLSESPMVELEQFDGFTKSVEPAANDVVVTHTAGMFRTLISAIVSNQVTNCMLAAVR